MNGSQHFVTIEEILMSPLKKFWTHKGTLQETTEEHTNETGSTKMETYKGKNPS